MDNKSKETTPAQRRAQAPGAAGLKPGATPKSAPAITSAARINAKPIAASAKGASTQTQPRNTAPVVRTAAGDYRRRSAATVGAKAGGAPITIDVHKRSATHRTGASAANRRAPRSQGSGIRHSKRRVTPKWVPALLCVCVMALLGVGYVGVRDISGYMNYSVKCAALNTNTFYDGIKLEGESLSGLTLFDAIDKYTKRLGDVSSSTNITITARDKTYTLDSSAVQMNANLQSTLNLAYSIGRSGSLDERYQKLQELKTNGLNFTLNRGWNEQTLRAKIDEIASDVYVKGQNASIASFDPDSGKFTFASEVTGYELDSDDLYSQITQAVANGNVSAKIEAKVTTVTPKYDVAYMQEHFGRISTMTTKTTDNSQRNKNIELAAATFNGKVVQPGDTLSFNATTGERTEAKGYKPAGAYKGGVLIQEPGGGVCQVSTTLYNAACKADMKIIERSPHSRVSNYIGIGLDAAVNWPNQDMKFKNTTDFPIYIVAEFSAPNLTFKIYGKQLDDGEYIKLESEKTDTIPAIDGVIEKNDPTIPVGKQTTEKAREGAKAVSYKVYYDKDGNEINRVQLDTSSYPASQTIIRIGTGTDVDT